MAKLTLKSVQKAIGIGTFVQKTIKFRDINGKEVRGRYLLKPYHLIKFPISQTYLILRVMKKPLWINTGRRC